MIVRIPFKVFKHCSTSDYDVDFFPAAKKVSCKEVSKNRLTTRPKIVILKIGLKQTWEIVTEIDNHILKIIRSNIAKKYGGGLLMVCFLCNSLDHCDTSEDRRPLSRQTSLFLKNETKTDELFFIFVTNIRTMRVESFFVQSFQRNLNM